MWGQKQSIAQSDGGDVQCNEGDNNGEVSRDLQSDSCIAVVHFLLQVRDFLRLQALGNH